MRHAVASRRPLVATILTACFFGALFACQSDDGQEGLGSEVPLYQDLGDHHRTISTDNPNAQTYFDQGLRLQYAFNHPEAVRSYEYALQLDPECAMCLWGIALASGPSINGPMTEESGIRAYQAIEQAGGLAAASEIERALINALAARYGPDPSLDRPMLDTAYAAALGELAATYPDDPDVLTLYAASLMNLNPWNYWEGDYRDRMPREGTELILELLESAMRLDADHPGACHYYIHAVEAAYPERAVECADRLAELMPGAGHIVHMPGHIYIRVGRYADAVMVNEHAVHEDETFIQDQGISSVYTGAYYPHNYHFMAFAATMAGMSDKAIEASRLVSSRVPPEVARAVPWIQNAVVLPQLTYLTFGRWQELLEEPLPDEILETAMTMARYARGVAFAAQGKVSQATEILDSLSIVASAADPDVNPIPIIAVHALAGEIALRTGDADGAVEHFAAAVAVEDEMLYEEPPLWYYPVRHSLGRALLEAGRPAEAEVVYRQDLDRFRQNGWALYGLAVSLEAQEKTATEEWAAFGEAWAGADVELSASRF